MILLNLNKVPNVLKHFNLLFETNYFHLQHPRLLKIFFPHFYFFQIIWKFTFVFTSNCLYNGRLPDLTDLKF